MTLREDGTDVEFLRALARTLDAERRRSRFPLSLSGIERLKRIATELSSTVTGEDALQVIADLPTGKNEDVMEGQEQAYRAVEALFPFPPTIHCTEPTT
jgi:hypothetical protein